jgi:hypothetical protein
MISSQEQDEIRRFYEAIEYVRSHGERIKELERRLMQDEKRKAAEERVPHQPHQVIWVQPWCSICDLHEYEDLFFGVTTTSGKTAAESAARCP